MGRTEHTSTDETHEERKQESTATAHATADDADDPPPGEEAAGWFATSALRIGLAMIGLVLLLVALGQIAGVNFLELFADVLASPIGRWLVVAFVALLILSFAVRGFGRWNSS
jgi:hypothetical protein